LSRSPIQNLPAQAIISSIETRLSGNIKRLDLTVLPIYDAFPSTFRGWDFIELFGHDIEMIDQGLYRAEVTLNIFSSYSGYKEANSVLEQVNNFLAAQLRDMTGFIDVSEGGSFLSARATKRETEAGEVVRQIVYKREWQIADNKF